MILSFPPLFSLYLSLFPFFLRLFLYLLFFFCFLFLFCFVVFELENWVCNLEELGRKRDSVGGHTAARNPKLRIAQIDKLQRTLEPSSMFAQLHAHAR